MSNAGGLSAGGVITPTILAFFVFDQKNSIYLSNASMCLSALIRYIMNFKKNHPYTPGRRLIDYNYVVLMLPPLVVVFAIGDVVNVFVPNVITISVLTLCLGILFVTNLFQVIRLF